MVARGYITKTHPTGTSEFRYPLILKIGIFVLGIVYSYSKLLVSSGVDWTKMWASCYLASYAVVFLMVRLAALAEKEEIRQRQPGQPRDRMGWLDLFLGFLAISLQLITLAWVDLAAIPPNVDVVKRIKFHTFRFGGNAVAVLIHFIFASLDTRGITPSFDMRKRIALVLAIGIVTILITLHGFKLFYTQMYYFSSIILAVASWLLFWIPSCKELVCVSGDGDFRHVATFDFFCRNFFLSLFWYVTCYHSNNTSKPNWADIFG
jgi:hypothetical protein